MKKSILKMPLYLTATNGGRIGVFDRGMGQGIEMLINHDTKNDFYSKPPSQPLTIHDTMGDYFSKGIEGDLIFAPLDRSGMTKSITPIVQEMLESEIILDVRGDYLRREKGDYELIYCAIRPWAIYNLRGER